MWSYLHFRAIMKVAGHCLQLRVTYVFPVIFVTVTFGRTKFTSLELWPAKRDSSRMRSHPEGQLRESSKKEDGKCWTGMLICWSYDIKGMKLSDQNFL
jgi:hypothetical protein